MNSKRYQMINNGINYIKYAGNEIIDLGKEIIALRPKDYGNALLSLVTNIAKVVFAAGFYASLTPLCPYLLAISFTAGLAFPDFFMEKTSQVFAGIFQTKNLIPLPIGASKLAKINHVVKNNLNYISPIAVTGFVGFFGLPVVAVQIFSVLAGLRLGSYFGKMADNTNPGIQPLYHA